MSWKRAQPDVVSRIRSGYPAGLSTFLILCAVVGLISRLSGVGDLYVGLFVIICIVGLSLLIAWYRGRSTIVPTSVVEELGEAERYVAQYCSPEHLQEACDLTKPYYGDEYVEGSIAEQWRIKNPIAFVEIVNESGELCACFGLLGLTEDFRRQFYAGNATDTRLRAADILAPDETKRCQALYISGIVVRDPMTMRSGKRTRVMLWALLQYYKDHFSFRIDRTLYGLAANNVSENLLKTFEFKMRCAASTRRDECNLYDIKMNKQVWKDIMNRVWDLSGICRVEWKAKDIRTACRLPSRHRAGVLPDRPTEGLSLF